MDNLTKAIRMYEDQEDNKRENEDLKEVDNFLNEQKDNQK